jgi:hypothetical protein
MGALPPGPPLFGDVPRTHQPVGKPYRITGHSVWYLFSPFGLSLELDNKYVSECENTIPVSLDLIDLADWGFSNEPDLLVNYSLGRVKAPGRCKKERGIGGLGAMHPEKKNQGIDTGT